MGSAVQAPIATQGLILPKEWNWRYNKTVYDIEDLLKQKRKEQFEMLKFRSEILNLHGTECFICASRKQCQVEALTSDPSEAYNPFNYIVICWRCLKQELAENGRIAILKSNFSDKFCALDKAIKRPGMIKEYYERHTPRPKKKRSSPKQR